MLTLEAFEKALRTSSFNQDLVELRSIFVEEDTRATAEQATSILESSDWDPVLLKYVSDHIRDARGYTAWSVITRYWKQVTSHKLLNLWNKMLRKFNFTGFNPHLALILSGGGYGSRAEDFNFYNRYRFITPETRLTAADLRLKFTSGSVVQVEFSFQTITGSSKDYLHKVSVRDVRLTGKLEDILQNIEKAARQVLQEVIDIPRVVSR